MLLSRILWAFNCHVPAPERRGHHDLRHGGGGGGRAPNFIDQVGLRRHQKKDIDLVKVHTSKPSPVLRIIKTAEEQYNDFILEVKIYH